MEAPLQPVSGEEVAIPDGLAPVQQPFSEHPVDAYLARLTSPASRRVQASALELIARRIAGDAGRSPADRRLCYQVPWHQLTAAHTGRIRALLLAPDPATGRPLAPATLNRTLVALRRVLKECWRLGLMDRESYERAADLDSLPGTRLPTGRDLSMGELRALFEVCAADPSPVGRRDAALFALLREGLRRGRCPAAGAAGPGGGRGAGDRKARPGAPGPAAAGGDRGAPGLAGLPRGPAGAAEHGAAAAPAAQAPPRRHGPDPPPLPDRGHRQPARRAPGPRGRGGPAHPPTTGAALTWATSSISAGICRSRSSWPATPRPARLRGTIACRPPPGDVPLVGATCPTWRRLRDLRSEVATVRSADGLCIDISYLRSSGASIGGLPWAR
jgi:hypothetical protein